MIIFVCIGDDNLTDKCQTSLYITLHPLMITVAYMKAFILLCFLMENLEVAYLVLLWLVSTYFGNFILN